MWHTMKLTSWLWLSKNSGSLHIMIFRYYGNILVSMQSYFWNVKGVKKFMFGCHILTYSTKLRRLPLSPHTQTVKFKCWIFDSKNRPTISHTSAPSQDPIHTLKSLFTFFTHVWPLLNNSLLCLKYYIFFGVSVVYCVAKDKAYLRSSSLLDNGENSTISN